MPFDTDINLTAQDIAGLVSADAVAAFFQHLGYDTARRSGLTPQAIGLTGDAAAPIKSIEILSEDAEGFLRVVFVQLKSLTAKSRNDLARKLGNTNVDHLLVLTKDFSILEFVLVDKDKVENRGAGRHDRVQVVPRSITVDRRDPSHRTLRSIRQFSWTCQDSIDQFTKLQIVFRAVPFTEDYFQNRALFADHYLVDRLRDGPAWRENPSDVFFKVQDLLKDGASRWRETAAAAIRDELYKPLFHELGFNAVSNGKAEGAEIHPDCILENRTGQAVSAAFICRWDRWLDGPDPKDDRNPDENPGAKIVTALENSRFNWLILTNGRLWRLYSRETHSRATNYYEVDLIEALIAAGDTDPNEAFRYWWLFFRAAAFTPPLSKGGAEGVALPGIDSSCWLDEIVLGSRDYAKRLGERLKSRIFDEVFRDLAQGFLENRTQHATAGSIPSKDDLDELFEATLTLLYRLLFLLYAESRELLPVREAAYQQKSLKALKGEVAERAGIAASEVEQRLKKSYSDKQTGLYARLCELFRAMGEGNADLNIPTYNGGLFVTSPNDSHEREHRIGRFLCAHQVPDRHLARAIDRLARDEDEKTFALVFIDYKSLAVRHLGSIYEGLLEYRLNYAEEDLTTDGKGEKYISLTDAPVRRTRGTGPLVRKGSVFLSTDKFGRKASGSYYTPDPVVDFIVRNTVGRVLDEKLEPLHVAFREASKTFYRELKNAESKPAKKHDGTTWNPREFAEERIFNTHRELVDRLFDLRVLDPAMGSGHFLVEAVDYLTDRLIAFLNMFPNNPVAVTLKRTKQQICEALEKQGVTIDARRLTEVNLLKRHVLKRCIYGVDLNPMAVELAKVSLWLDAFTIGAPLSFLDHHVHCGNSLVGLAFADLKTVTRKSLIPIDYVPLINAINQLLSISQRTDTTALEVRTSTTEYDQAREKLGGYQLALDLLTARYFGLDRADDIVITGHDLEWGSRRAFVLSLENNVHRQMVADAEQLGARRDLKFFHWDTEFPEVFYDFPQHETQRVLHKDELTPGSAGFDAVIGNPPYVRMELIKPLKPFLKLRYRCHAERADLFIYFYERAIMLLRRGGYSAFIASSTWTKTKSGEGLREFLKTSASVISFLDFGDLPVFEDANTYPCVMVLRKERPT
ncbi:MAG TPA: Eco57I restriction-modification methylase domain-containing protein, partial [Planctomycetaceae bacterium]